MSTSGASRAGVDIQAERLGFRVITMAPELATATVVNLASGTAVYQLVYAPSAFTLTQLAMEIRGAGATSTGANTMAAYTVAGVLIGETADMTAAFSAANAWAVGAVAGAPTVPAGPFYIGALTHFTTPPTTYTTAHGGGGGVSVQPVNSRYPTIFAAGVTNFPASFTPSGLSLNSGGYIMAAK